VGRKVVAKLVEIVNQRGHDRGFGLAANAGIGAGETLEQAGNFARGIGAGSFFVAGNL
jgi:hypothetical protein